MRGIRAYDELQIVVTEVGQVKQTVTAGTEALSRGVKEPGCDVDYPPSSSVEVKERVKLYVYPLPVPKWHSIW